MPTQIGENRAKKMLKDNADKISGDSKGRIEKAVADVKEALKGRGGSTRPRGRPDLVGLVCLFGMLAFEGSLSQ